MDDKNVATVERGRMVGRFIIEKWNRRGLRCSCGCTLEEDQPLDPSFLERVAAGVGEDGNLMAWCPRCGSAMSWFSPDHERYGGKRLGRRLRARLEREGRLVAEATEPNLLLNEGIAELWDLAITTGATKYDNTNAQLGVGNGTAAAAATQVDLQGGSTSWKAMEATYPSRSAQTVSWQSVYGSSDANFAWEEFSVRNGATADKNLNRKVENKGTKSSGTTWTLTLQITLS